MKVAMIGLGYVGTVTTACLAAHGHDAWGVIGILATSLPGYEGIGW